MGPVPPVFFVDLCGGVSVTRKAKKTLQRIVLSPILLFFAVFFCFAVGFSILISFRVNMLVSPIGAPFVGLSNYLSLFSDPMFRSGLLNTVVFALIVHICERYSCTIRRYGTLQVRGQQCGDLFSLLDDNTCSRSWKDLELSL